MDKRELDNYNEIYNVLNQIEVRGHSNVAKMKGTMDFLATLIDMQKNNKQSVSDKDK